MQVHGGPPVTENMVQLLPQLELVRLVLVLLWVIPLFKAGLALLP